MNISNKFSTVCDSHDIVYEKYALFQQINTSLWLQPKNKAVPHDK